MRIDSSPIVAIATATGRGAVGIVRLSGHDLHHIAQRIAPDNSDLTPRTATLTPFIAPDGSVIDQGLAIYFPAPHSYTGEDVLELQAHGGSAVLQLIVQACLDYGKEIGLRLAEAGEFTQRAFLNNKMDLAQAEAVSDLIEAQTSAAAKAAAQSLTGAFSEHIDTLQEQLIHTRMLVEANLDFPEEDIDSLDVQAIHNQIEGIRESIYTTLQQAQQGALLREGIKVVLAGQPNVGKSSLLNTLAGAELAIVTDIAGTTRDTKEQLIQIQGVPLHIIDTAGLRDSSDVVEQMGMQRAWQAIEQADIILHLHDAALYTNNSTALEHTQTKDAELAKQFRQRAPHIPYCVVWNKIDTLDSTETSALETTSFTTPLRISAATGAGLDALKHTLLETVGWQEGQAPTFSARTRHVDALKDTLHHCNEAATLLTHEQRSQTGSYQLDLLAEELRLAQSILSKITGEFSSDDLLGTIFAKFCIGK